MAMDPKWIDFMREQYPKGSRIKLREMKDPYHPVEPGTMGTLDHIDDLGTFHVRWDNGSGLGLVIGEDSFSVLPPEPTLLKLYMPLTADLYERNRYGDLEEESTELDARDLVDFIEPICTEMKKTSMPEERKRGIMHWYSQEDSVNKKVRSAVFTVDLYDGRLWGVAECQVLGELTPDELATLKDYVAGQASDGWGESFEQRAIPAVDDGEVYVHLWSSEKSWCIQTEQELFEPKLAEGLPEMCFSTLQLSGELVCIKRGEIGYYPSEWSTDDKEQNVELADLNNEKLGVTPAQRQAMEVGAMCGWGVPGADPKAYEWDGPRMGGMNRG